MVRDEVWYRAKVPHQEVLCVACLEKAMARKLNILDFKDVPANKPIFDAFMGIMSTSIGIDVHNKELLGKELRKRLPPA